ncbi:GNAT family N-acetyltransferase [Salipiger sp. PrR002]|uniref:GNAT family N-acetyltransferase n=1 Tax=Salipiger sp. PrR002 TaxID=2706489 RepID=UPI0013B7011C|nr:N-acetyltransferase [Salipiger sp. PrR002]NDV97921.1 GNAT family N-acetyltransferase [Salipiger sp. PrR002]NDW55412.1 GNAT family N-acetyltransferase [Salipiger sp. PrR004]
MPLRDATLTDASSLAALSVEVWLGTYIRHGVSARFANYALDTFTRANFERWLKSPPERFIVSQNRDGIDGFLRLSTGAPGPLPGCGSCEIATLYVQPRHHGRGIGRALLQAGLRMARDQGAASVWLTTNSENAPAIAFYHRMGLQHIGETHFRIDGEAYPNHVFVHPPSQPPAA